MSGSGPTCFGLFSSSAAADQAARAIAVSQTGGWVVATRLAGAG
jgi:4-diphosphocytidyl-2C-methyl-D-erythritol kinase